MTTTVPANRVLGFDCSQWQNDVSTAQVMNMLLAFNTGMRYVYIKASQRYLDRDYILNWGNAEGVMPRGAYHFYDWGVSYDIQIDLFCQLINNDPGELPPVMDYEMATGCPAKVTASGIAYKFLNDLGNRTGLTPMLYTSPGFWAAHGSTNVNFKKFYLWIANYQVAKPTVPAPWTEWTFWQDGVYQDGKYHGAESYSLDHDQYNGNEEKFRTFAGLAAPVMTLEQTVAMLVANGIQTEGRLQAIVADIKELQGRLNILHMPQIMK
jgi:lysozyme